MEKRTSSARALRRRQTDAEHWLWHRLRSRQISGAKFRRQAPLGPYIVDFVCFEQKLVIEVDGGQHRRATDAGRTAYLESCGYHVMRFWNNEVFNNMAGVLTAISGAVAPSPLVGEGGTREAGG